MSGSVSGSSIVPSAQVVFFSRPDYSYTCTDGYLPEDSGAFSLCNVFFHGTLGTHPA